jgi:hypothetical protein
MMHMPKWISSEELATKRIPDGTRSLCSFYAGQGVPGPPPLEPAAPPLQLAAPPLEPAAADNKMRQSAFDVLHVIVLAQVLVICFLVWIIWKLI